MPLDTVAARSRRRRLPSVDVPRVENDELRRSIEALKEHVRMYEGDSGAPKERFVTIQELELAGLIGTKIQGNYALIDEVLGGDVAQGQQSGSQTIVFEGDSSVGGGGSGTLAGLSDTNVDGAVAGSFLQLAGGQWVGTNLAGYNVNWIVSQTFNACLRISGIDSGYVDFCHDDTDLNITGTDTTDMNIIGMNVNLDDLAEIQWSDTTQLVVDGANPNADPNIGSVITLFTLENAAAGATTVNAVIGGYSISKVGTGTGEVSADQAKFGSNSLKIAYASGVNYGQMWSDTTGEDGFRIDAGDGGDWTFELHLYMDNFTAATQQDLWRVGGTSTNESYAFRFDSLTQLSFKYSPNGTTTRVANCTCSALSLDTWYHIAWVREGDDIRMYVDGTLEYTGTNFFFNNSVSEVINWPTSPATNLFIIANDGFAQWYWDNVRITRGVARYTTNFTAPTGPYDEGNSAGLLTVGNTGGSVRVPTDLTVVTTGATYPTDTALTIGYTGENEDLRMIRFVENIDGVTEDGFYVDYEGVSNSPGNQLHFGSDKPSSAGTIFWIGERGQLRIEDNLSNAATLSSTEHPLQIGPDAGINMRFGRNEIQTALNGAETSLSINPFGGDVRFFESDYTTDYHNFYLYLGKQSTISGRFYLIGDSANLNSFMYWHPTSPDLIWTAGSTTEDLEISGWVQVRFEDQPVRFTNWSGADYAEFSHDDTDFNTTFAQTTDWNISGLTGSIIVGDPIRSQMSQPQFLFEETDAALNEKVWKFTGSGGDYFIQAMDDTFGAPVTALRIYRTGTTIDQIDLNATLTNITGNLTVAGTTTTINSNTVSIADNIITLNSDAVDPPTENAGIEVYRGGVTNDVAIRWNETADDWEVTYDGTNYYGILTDNDTPFIADGTVTNATLRWSGTDWIQSSQVLSDASGNLTVDNGNTTGQVALGNATLGGEKRFRLLNLSNPLGKDFVISSAAATYGFYNRDEVRWDLQFNDATDIATFGTNIAVTGNITVTGTVDGRDVATDGTNQDNHIADGTIHFTQAAISIPLSQISDVTATAAEVNLLDLAGLTAGWVLSADTATTASWKQLSHTSLSDIGTNTHVQIDTHIALTNEHIDWTSATQNLSTTGTVSGSNLNVSNWDTAYTITQRDFNSNPFINTSRQTTTPDTVGDTYGVNFQYLASSATPKPAGLTDGALTTLSYSAAWQTQMLTDWRNSGRIWIRGQNSTVWSDWEQVWSSADFSIPQGEIAYGVTGGGAIDSSPNLTYASSQLTVVGSAQVLTLKGGASDHAYVGFYADAAAQSTRSAFVGFGAAASETFQITNEYTNGGIYLSPNGTGNVQLGTLTFDSDQALAVGLDNYVLTYDHGTGLISLEAAPSGSTDLTWTASTRTIASSTGTDAVITLFTSTDAGLVPLSGGGTTNYLRADGTWAAPPGGSASNSFETQTVTDTDSGFTWAATGSAVADGSADTLTWVSGTGINIDVDATSDAIRITNTFDTLAESATDVTATAAEVNLLDLAGLTAGWGLIADTATTASWQQIDHVDLANIGTNTHAQIDTHIGDSTLHFTEASIDHGSIAGLGDDDHPQYAEIGNTEIITGVWTHNANVNLNNVNYIGNTGQIVLEADATTSRAMVTTRTVAGVSTQILRRASSADTLNFGNGSFALVIDGSGVTINPNTDFSNGIDVTGNITVTGTVDGKDVAGHVDDSTIHFTQAGITTVGTITTGVWNGTALTAAYVPNHDDLNGFVANEHIDWTGATQTLNTTGDVNSGAGGASGILLSMNDSNGYIVQAGASVGGWARGLVVTKQSDTLRLGGAGWLGSGESLTSFHVGFGASWWAGDSVFEISPAGNVTIDGNLTVSGTTTTINSNTVSIADHIITLNSDEAGVPSQDAGLEVERGTSANVFLKFAETGDRWHFTNDGSTYYNIPISSEYTTDHTALSNIGTNTHAQIDTHIALTNEHIDWTNATQNFETSGRALITGVSVGGSNGSSLVLASSNPQFSFSDTDATTNEKVWNWIVSAGNLSLRTLDDSWALAETPMLLTRTAGVVDLIQFDATNVDFQNTTSVRVRDGANIRVYDSVDTSYVETLHSGTAGTIRTDNAAGGNLNLYAQNGAAFVQVSNGSGFRIYNSTNSALAAYTHDGIDFNTTFTATTDWEVSGITNFSVAANIRINNNDDYLNGVEVGGTARNMIGMNASDQVVVGNTTSSMILNAGPTASYSVRTSGNERMTLNEANTSFNLYDGYTYKIWDGGNTDNAAFSHDGTDFNLAFANTTDWDISGLSNQIKVQDGIAVSQWDSTGSIRKVTVDRSSSVSSASGWVRVAHAASSTGRGYAIITLVGNGGGLHPGPLQIIVYSDWTAGAPGFSIMGSPTSHSFDDIRVGYDVTNNKYVDVSLSNVTAGTFTIMVESVSAQSGDVHWVADFNATPYTPTSSWSIDPRGKQLALLDDNGNHNFIVDDQAALVSTVLGFRIYDSTSTDYVNIAHDGTDLQVTGVNVQNFAIQDVNSQFQIYNGAQASFNYLIGSGLQLRDGTYLRMSDAADTDWALFSHDGTDFNTAFTNTTDWNITGLTGQVLVDSDVLITGTGADGDRRLIVEADSDNWVTNELSNAELWLAQDGRGVLGYFRTTEGNNIEIGSSSTTIGTFNTPVFSWAYNSNTVDVKGPLNYNGINVHDNVNTFIRYYNPGWTNATTHDVLKNSYTVTTGDIMLIKAAGNSVGSHGILGVGDNGLYWGRTDQETGLTVTDSNTPFDNANYFRVDTSSFVYAHSIHLDTEERVLYGTANGARVQVGPDGSGHSGVLGSTQHTDAASLDYRTYWAYDAHWDDVNNQWEANRTTLGRKWVAEMGYHQDSFTVRRFDGTVSAPWADTAWSTLFTIDSTGSIDCSGITTDAGIRLNMGTPNIFFDETDGGTDQNVWRLRAAGGQFQFHIGDDAEANFTKIMHVDRSGTGAGVTVDQILFNADVEIQSAGGNEVLTIQDTGGAGTAADPFIAFRDSANTRIGYVGIGSGSTNDIYVLSDAGNVQLTAGGGTIEANDILDMNGNNINDAGRIYLDALYMNETSAAQSDVAGDGQLWTKSNAPTDLYFTTDNGLDYPVAYARYRVTADTTLDGANVSETLGVQHINGVWYSDNATAYTLTLQASGVTTFPVGAQMTIWNEGSGTLTINEGASTTLYVLTGSAVTDSAGGCTMAQGGYATLIRKSTTVYLIMGAGITP